MPANARIFAALDAAQTVLAVQSCAAAHQGHLLEMNTAAGAVRIPAVAHADLLKAWYEFCQTDATDPVAWVTIKLQFFSAAASSTEVRGEASTMMYGGDEMGINQATISSFMGTMQGTLTAMKEGRRPPDRPAPG